MILLKLLKKSLQPQSYFLFFIIIFGYILLNLNFLASDKDLFLFFSQHYKKNWFSLQDLHLGGITYLNAYPPLVFQIMALLLFVISDLKLAYTFIMLIFWILLTFYASKTCLLNFNLKDKYFKFIFLLIFFSIGLFRAVLVYGWLTFIAGLSFVFMSWYYFYLFLKNKEKSKLSFILPAILAGFANIYAFIILIGIFVFVAIANYNLILKKIQFRYLLMFLLIMLLAYFFAFLYLNEKFINYVEVFHKSRNPLETENINLWFYTIYGLELSMVAIFLLYRPLHRYWKLYALSIIFLLIGLGRTTPLAQFIFGNLEKVLTFDRFLTFSAILLTWFFGVFIVTIIKNFRESLQSKILIAIFFIYLSFNLTEILMHYDDPLFRTEGKEEAKNFVLGFLNNHSIQYRYQTLGYPGLIGDFYLYTKMPTTDTDFISFSNIEFVKSAGIRQINLITDETLLSSFFNDSSKYSVKYVITFDGFYVKFTKEQNWKVIENKTFGNFNVVIWENPNKIEPIKPTQEKITLFNYLWGTVPLSTLFLFIFMLAYRKFYKS